MTLTATVPEIDLVNALNNFLVAGIGAFIVFIFKLAYDRTFAKDLKRSDEFEQLQEQEVDELKDRINQLEKDMQKLDTRLTVNEQIVAEKLNNLQVMFTEIKQDFRKDLEEIKRMLRPSK